MARLLLPHVHVSDGKLRQGFAPAYTEGPSRILDLITASALIDELIVQPCIECIGIGIYLGDDFVVAVRFLDVLLQRVNYNRLHEGKNGSILGLHYGLGFLDRLNCKGCVRSLSSNP